MSECRVEGCGLPVRAQKRCALHYQRAVRSGEIQTAKRVPVDSRFWSYVARSATCWTWTGATSDQGYGVFAVRHHVQVKAHRFAFEITRGPIPAGLVLDHLCRNRSCVNPSHLEPVDNVENVMRGYSPQAVNARTQKCAQGHEFETKIRASSGKPRRYCRECHNAQRRERRAARRTA